MEERAPPNCLARLAYHRRKIVKEKQSTNLPCNRLLLKSKRSNYLSEMSKGAVDIIFVSLWKSLNKRKNYNKYNNIFPVLGAQEAKKENHQPPILSSCLGK